MSRSKLTQRLRRVQETSQGVPDIIEQAELLSEEEQSEAQREYDTLYIWRGKGEEGILWHGVGHGFTQYKSKIKDKSEVQLLKVEINEK